MIITVRVKSDYLDFVSNSLTSDGDFVFSRSTFQQHEDESRIKIEIKILFSQTNLKK